MRLHLPVLVQVAGEELRLLARFAQTLLGRDSALDRGGRHRLPRFLGHDACDDVVRAHALERRVCLAQSRHLPADGRVARAALFLRKPARHEVGDIEQHTGAGVVQVVDERDRYGSEGGVLAGKAPVRLESAVPGDHLIGAVRQLAHERQLPETLGADGRDELLHLAFIHGEVVLRVRLDAVDGKGERLVGSGHRDYLLCILFHIYAISCIYQRYY